MSVPHWPATISISADASCKACGIVSHARSTLARVHTVAKITSTNGIPTAVAFHGFALDTELLARIVVASDINAAHTLIFQRASAALGAPLRKVRGIP